MGFISVSAIPNEQIKIVAALHGPANMLNYDDSFGTSTKLGRG